MTEDQAVKGRMVAEDGVIVPLAELLQRLALRSRDPHRFAAYGAAQANPMRFEAGISDIAFSRHLRQTVVVIEVRLEVEGQDVHSFSFLSSNATISRPIRALRSISSAKRPSRSFVKRCIS